VHDEVVVVNKVPARLVEGVFAAIGLFLFQASGIHRRLAVTVRSARMSRSFPLSRTKGRSELSAVPRVVIKGPIRGAHEHTDAEVDPDRLARRGELFLRHLRAEHRRFKVPAFFANRERLRYSPKRSVVVELHIADALYVETTGAFFELRAVQVTP